MALRLWTTVECVLRAALQVQLAMILSSMIWIYKMTIYQIVVLIATIIGLIHYKRMDKASKVILWFIVVTFISETAAFSSAIIYNNNLLVYHIYNPIQFLIICYYYNLTIEAFKSRNIGLKLGIIGVLYSTLNTLYFQNPLREMNTNFLIPESILIIAMSLYSFYELLASESYDVYSNNKFWFSAFLLTFWSFTFCYWLIGPSLYKSTKNTLWLDIMIWAINVLCYSGFAIVFLSFRKMKKA